MNVELLRKVQAVILEEPKRIYMENWVRAIEPGYASDNLSGPACGTIACIYGWGLSIETGLFGRELEAFVNRIRDTRCSTIGSNETPIWKKDQNIFDLTPVQQEKLYFTFNWPAQFRDKVDPDFADIMDGAKYYDPQTPEYAQVVADRIEYMIETGE